MLVGFAVGGGSDIVARIIAPRLSEQFRQQVVVDNRPGAGSSIASEIAAKSLPDGYTLIMISSSHTINAGIYKKLSYHPVNDFTAVSLAVAAPNVLVVTLSLPVKSLAEFIALARAKPGQLNFASSGTGGSSHLSGELLKRMAGIELTHVPYKGAAPALTDVIAGQVQLLFPSMPTVLTQIRAGRVKALAVTALKRSPALPDVPTVAESIPGYEATNWYGVLAPASTPKPVINALNAAILNALRTPAVADAITAQGADAVGSTPAEFQAYLKSEVEKWGKLIRDAGISPE